MEKKYMLTDETKIVCGRKLYRIKALKNFSFVEAGDLGGFIEKEENLSQEGDAWVYDNAKVFNNAQIRDNAWAYGNAWVFDDAQIYDNARVFGNAKIHDNAQIYGRTNVFGNAIVFENAQIYGYARICMNAQIFGHALVYDDVLVKENARIFENAQVYDNAQIYDHTQIYGNAQICKNAIISGHAAVYGNAVVSQYQCVSYGIVKTDLTKPENLVSSIRVQCNLPVINNKVIAYKLVRPDLTSFYDKNFQYKVGKEIEVKDYDESDKSCSSGLHFSNLTYWEGNIADEDEGFICLEAEIDLNDIITVQNGKIRCRKAKILRSFSF